jgi:hypothetical protein
VVWGVGRRPLGCWGRGIESRSGHGYLLCLYVVLSCVCRGLCDGLITRPEKSYRVSICVWDQKPPKKGGLRSILDYKRVGMNEFIFIQILIATNLSDMKSGLFVTYLHKTYRTLWAQVQWFIIIIRLWSPIRALASPAGGFVTITFLQGCIVSPGPNPQPGGPGLRIYDPRRQGGPAIPPDTRYPF